MDIKRLIPFLTVLFAMSVSACGRDNSETLPKAEKPKLENSAVTYYVDSQNGSDYNDGKSEKTPWKSLYSLNFLKKWHPGDSVLLKRGSVFNQELTIKNAIGNKDSIIVIDCYGSGAKPKIIGTGKASQAVLLFNCSFIELRNLDIKNTVTDIGVNSRMGVLVHVEDFGVAHNIFLKGLDVHDVNGSIVKSEEGEKSAIVVRPGTNGKVSYFDGVLIEDCTVRDCTRNGISVRGIGSRTNWHPSLNVVIRRNLLERVAGDGIVPAGCDGALVEYNIMRDCTDPWGNMKEAAAGIWPFACDNTVVQFNESSGHKAPWDGQGYDADYNSRNNIIRYNYSHDNYGGFLLICDPGESWQIGNKNVDVYGNVSINDGCRPFPLYHSVGGEWFSSVVHITGPMTDGKFRNNIIHVYDRIPGLEQQDKTFIKFGNWGGTYPSNFEIRDNVFYSSAADCKFTILGSKNLKFSGNYYLGLNKNALNSSPELNKNTFNDEYMSILSTSTDPKEAIEKKFLRTIELPVGKITTVSKEAVDKFFDIN